MGKAQDERGFLKFTGEFPGGPVLRRLRAFTVVAWVQSLIGELRSRKPRHVAKKKKHIHGTLTGEESRIEFKASRV